MRPYFEYWFDFSCPYAYLASTQIEAVAARTGAELQPRPLLLGGVFKALEVPQALFLTLGPKKAEHNANDLRRHAALYGVPLTIPDGHPRRTVDALRALLAVGEPFMPLARRFFRAYWVDGIDLGTPAGVRRVLVEGGLDADSIIARAASDHVKSDLRRRTEEAIARQVFGVPTFFAGGDLFFGQDRLPDVEERLGGKPERPSPAKDEHQSPVDFYFDYSSPFSYVAAMRAEPMFKTAARWRPMLLGAVFKTVGTPDVPMFNQNAPKRRHTKRDLERQAKQAEIPFSWPSRFPMNTVLALRATLVAEGGQDEVLRSPRTRALARRLFRAFWAEDQDLADPSTVTRLLDEQGFDGREIVRRASEPPAKDALRRATEHAMAAGVFGAPTFIVHPEGRSPGLYWGADRLDLAVRAARGDTRVM